MRSQGAVALARVPQGGAEIASKVGVSEGLVSLWRSGKRKPSLPNRKLLLDLYKIPIESWDVPAATAAPARKPKRSAEEAWGSKSTKARAETLERELDEVRKTVKTESATPLERAKVLDKIFDNEIKLAKLKGELGAVDEATILRHPHWRRVESALLEALKPYPDALRAAGEALLALDHQ